MLLDRNERRIMEQFGQRHRLVLTSLFMEDFANYSCYAENELGKARQVILLSGGSVHPALRRASSSSSQVGH